MLIIEGPNGAGKSTLLRTLRETGRPCYHATADTLMSDFTDCEDNAIWDRGPYSMAYFDKHGNDWTLNRPHELLVLLPPYWVCYNRCKDNHEQWELDQLYNEWYYFKQLRERMCL